MKRDPFRPGSAAESSGAASQLGRLYCGYQFFFSLLLWLPIFYEFQKRIGLGDPEIFSIQSAYYLAFCLFEIPTGWWADRFGYLKCMRAGAALVAIANLWPVLFPTYSGMLWHFLGIALARSLVSGAGSAYLYESLAKHGELGRYKQIEGNARAYGLIGKVVLWLAVGKLMEWRLDLPYSLTSALTGISLVYAYRLKPLVKSAQSLSRDPGLSLPHAFARLRRTPILVLLMLQGIGLFVLARIVQVNLFQPILSSKAMDVGFYGVVLSSISVFEALGSARPAWIRRWLDDRNAVFSLTLVLAGVLLAIPWLGIGATWVGLAIFSLTLGFASPIQRQLINDAIPDGCYRATFLSLESILDRGACSLVAAGLAQALVHPGLPVFLSEAAIFTLGSMVLIQGGLIWADARRKSMVSLLNAEFNGDQTL